MDGLNQRESGCWNVNLLHAGCIDVGVHADVDDEVDIDVDVIVYSDVNAFFWCGYWRWSCLT